jgi:hypothetical protein
LKKTVAILEGFGEGWRLRLTFKNAQGWKGLSIMETTEAIWNGLENLLSLVGQPCDVEITGYKVTKIELAK